MYTVVQVLFTVACILFFNKWYQVHVLGNSDQLRLHLLVYISPLWFSKTSKYVQKTFHSHQISLHPRDSLVGHRKHQRQISVWFWVRRKLGTRCFLLLPFDFPKTSFPIFIKPQFTIVTNHTMSITQKTIHAEIVMKFRVPEKFTRRTGLRSQFWMFQ